jgi:hypothetical protein
LVAACTIIERDPRQIFRESRENRKRYDNYIGTLAGMWQRSSVPDASGKVLQDKLCLWIEFCWEFSCSAIVV